MQHVIIKYDPINKKPYITPYRAHLWRDDQDIMWSFAASNVWWDPEKAEPIVFADADPGKGISAWPGSEPAPIGPPPVPPARDRRGYVADGGTPNPGTAPILYVYDAWVEWSVAGEIGDLMFMRGKLQARSEDVLFEKIEPIDPEILNQPEP